MHVYTHKLMLMNSTLYKANTRGHLNFGWLDANYSFSFSNYYDPARIHFGALRVLNDDTIQAGMGFGTHPHDNMEICTIPLKGALEHKDSTGGHGVIRKNDIQIMSAGTGVYHSEFNHSKTDEANILQIWIFPKKKNITPRYDQKTFNPTDRINQFQTIVAPDDENALQLNQDTWLSLASFTKDTEISYTLHNTQNGIYAFLIEGNITVNNIDLHKRDAVGITETNKLDIHSTTNSELLLIEVPMTL